MIDSGTCPECDRESAALVPSDAASCVRLILQCRWYDTAPARWAKWGDLDSIEMVKGDEIPKKWVEQAEYYIGRGVSCEYRIIERIDRITWALS
jgi:hypothetical protein